MDESDEHRSGEHPESESPSTDRVRIIGAEPAASVLGDPAPGETPGEGGDPRPEFWAPEETETVATSPELPHWTEAPTGQVPAVLERRSDEDEDVWSVSGDTGPAWREHAHEWDDAAFEPALLANDETRVGAIEESPLEERQPWEFEFGDDEGVGAAGEVPAEVAWTAGAAEVGSGDPRADEDWVVRSHPLDEVLPSPTPRAARAKARRPMTTITSSTLRPLEAPEPPSPPPARPRGRVGAGAPAGAEQPADTTDRNLPLAIGTAVAFAVLAIICFMVGTQVTLVLVTLVVLVATAECYAALRRSGRRPATLLGLVGVGALMVAAYAKGVAAMPLVVGLVVVTTMIWYLAGVEKGSATEGIMATLLGFGWVGVLGSFGALLLAPSQFPHRHGIAFVVMAIVAVAFNDIGALAVGRWKGKHPLAPRVSPHKTWEGLVGGAVSGIIAAVVLGRFLHPWTSGKALVLGLVVAVVAPIGDLSESLIKRDLRVKDMGDLLPGHGGILDRFDALLFVLPATYYLVRAFHLG